MRKSDKYKPLWRIHNSTYSYYARGILKKRLARYTSKLKARLRFIAGQKR